MTKRLEELFGLNDDEPVSDDTIEESIATEPLPQSLNTPQTLETLEKIEAALPQVRDLSTVDKELNEYATLNKEAFNNLMDLGMQVEARHAAEIFNAASSMMGHAIASTVAKINKNIKIVELQLKQGALEEKLNSKVQKSNTGPTEKLPLGQGTVMSRDDLIKMIHGDAVNQDNKDK
jgi:hypothetical protein